MPTVSLQSKLGYGAGNLGLSFVTQSLVGFIMFFGTAVMNLSGTLMGLAFTIGIIWDAITDPVAGFLSDRTESKKFGRRHGYILLGTFLLAAANIFLWSLPSSISNFAKFIWMLFGILIFQTSCTVVNVPYHALALDLSGDYNEQTELQGIKAIFFLLGIILPIIIMAVLQGIPGAGGLDGRQDSSTYKTLGIIGSIIILICGLITFFSTYSHIPRLNKEARLTNKSKEKISLKKIIKNFFMLFKDINYRAVLICVCATNIASAFLTGIGMHVFTYTFKLSAIQMYLLLGELFVIIILSQPLWLYICQKIDKKPALMNGLKLTVAGLILLVLVFCLRSFIKDTNVLVAVLTIPVIIVGIGMGSTYLIPQAMIADVVAYNAKEEEISNNATVMGSMTFSFKIAQAFTLLIIGLMLDIIGFDSGADSATYEPSRGVQNGLGIVLSIGLLVSIAAALIFIRKYKLKKEDIPKIENKEKINSANKVKKTGEKPDA